MASDRSARPGAPSEGPLFPPTFLCCQATSLFRPLSSDHINWTVWCFHNSLFGRVDLDVHQSLSNYAARDPRFPSYSINACNRPKFQAPEINV
ncbi:hypothetical protein Cpir12675_006341 [Ceratocystis pirilliformis]|uniref:Uncharacterized protein n=1 Tax=Ceratocystis pirilliformis TaxID=259994 RepID=A0ABR3YJH0_9PEZI